MLLAAALLLRRPLAAGILSFAERVEGLGGWGPLAFVGALALAIPLCLPAGPFLLAAGVLFGALGGVAWATLGNLLGGALAFVLGRRLLRSWVEARLASRAGLEVMNRALRQEGFRSVALIRLSPLLPAWLINYGLGVSRVSWRNYGLSSVTVLPTVVFYVLAGVGLGDLAALEGGGPAKGVGYYALLGAGMLATLAASLLLGRRARRILDEMED